MANTKYFTSEIVRKVNGGAKGDRTPDLYAASVALSQLSYGPKISVYVGILHNSSPSSKSISLDFLYKLNFCGNKSSILIN